MPGPTTAELMIAVTVPGDVPNVGDTCSQFPPVVVAAAAVKLVVGPLKVSACETGMLPPLW